VAEYKIITGRGRDTLRAEEQNLKTIERIHVEQQTGGFRLLSDAAAYRVGGTGAVVLAELLNQVVKSGELEDFRNAVKQQEAAIAITIAGIEEEEGQRLGTAPAGSSSGIKLNMPPMWRRDP
jgi:hypothetical protein